MSARLEFPGAPAPRRKRGPALRALAAAVVGLLLFAAGLAVGSVLDDNPDPDTSPTQTLVRTLGPLPLSAPPTVTVTVTSPSP